MRRWVSLIQGIYYVLTGLWPVAHIESFMRVTGYKTDQWLVKMVGLLTVAVATTILLNYRREHQVTRQLGIFSAVAYLTIDVYYSLNGTISPIYLADAAVELAIVILLLTKSSPGSRHW